MVIGDVARFAIEMEVMERVTSRWIYCRLRFWLGGRPVGNWEDAADLRGCRNWLRDFAERPRDRCEPSLVGLAARDVVARLMPPLRRDLVGPTEVTAVVPDAFARFVISHLGMSSFDALDLLLVKDGEGNERCIWRHADGSVHEQMLAPCEMERVAGEFVSAVGEILDE